jgi:hypothetical protein
MRNERMSLQGRLWAALLCLPLAGCTQGGGTTPLGETLLGLRSVPDEAHRTQAEALPYASLRLTSQGSTSLVVLAYQGGEQGEQTLWQAQDEVTVELRHGRPYRTAGLPADLLSWHPPRAPEDSRYAVEAAWRDGDGLTHLARGEARLTCQPAEPLTLPLATLDLQRCEERIAWRGGEQSRNTLWRHPDTGRLWAGDIQPRPAAERIAWQVARPWWSE